MENLKKITGAELTPTLHIGREDSPELGTEGMQQLFDAHPNLNTKVINDNADIQGRNNTLIDEHMKNTQNPHKVTKEQLGLGSVDNTSDTDKPISTAQAEALSEKADKAYTDSQDEITLQSAKEYADTGLQAKADKADTYTKTEVDTKDIGVLTEANTYAKTYTDQKVVEIGTGDMAQAVYDPWGRKSNVFEHIENASIHAPVLTENKVIYVSPTGSDENGDGSEGNKYRTINFAKSKSPKLLVGYILALRIADGVYNEDVIIDNFTGNNIVVYATENVHIKSLTVLNVKGLWWQGATVTGFTTVGNQVEIASSQEVNLWGFKCTAIDKAKNGIRVTACPKALIFNSEISGKNIALQSSESIVNTCSLSGNNNNIGYLSGGNDMQTGGFITIGYNCTLTADILIKEQFGGKVFGGNQIKNWDAKLNIEGVEYTIKTGRFVKNGNVVEFDAYLAINSVTSSLPDVTEVKILNLPYAVSTDPNVAMLFTHVMNNISKIGFDIGYCVPYGTEILLRKIVNGSVSVLTLADLKRSTDVNRYISIVGRYFTRS